jgi:hypothetical protein
MFIHFTYNFIDTSEQFDIGTFARYIKIKYQANPLFNKFNIRMYFSYLDKTVTTIQEWLSQHDSSSEIYILMSEELKSYLELINQTKQLLYSSKPTTDLMLCLVNLFSDLKSKRDYEQKTMEISNLHEKLEDIFIETGFLHYITTNLSQNSQLMVVAGAAHVRKIVDHLINKLNYSVVSAMSPHSGNDPKNLGLICQSINQNLIHAINAFLAKSEVAHSASSAYASCASAAAAPASDYAVTGASSPSEDAMQMMQEKLNHLQVTENVCANCKKAATNEIKLSKCSRCKAVSYCSKECQKADWKMHKQSCS